MMDLFPPAADMEKRFSEMHNRKEAALQELHKARKEVDGLAELYHRLDYDYQELYAQWQEARTDLALWRGVAGILAIVLVAALAVMVATFLA